MIGRRIWAALAAWVLVLGPYWVAPVILVTRGVEAPPALLAGATLLYVLVQIVADGTTPNLGTSPAALVDAAGWGLGFGFVSAATFLPLFVCQLTDASWAIGLIPAILALGWYAPGEGAGLVGAIVGAIVVLFVWGLIAKRRV